MMKNFFLGALLVVCSANVHAALSDGFPMFDAMRGFFDVECPESIDVAAQNLYEIVKESAEDGEIDVEEIGDIMLELYTCQKCGYDRKEVLSMALLHAFKDKNPKLAVKIQKSIDEVGKSVLERYPYASAAASFAAPIVAKIVYDKVFG